MFWTIKTSQYCGQSSRIGGRRTLKEEIKFLPIKIVSCWSSSDEKATKALYFRQICRRLRISKYALANSSAVRFQTLSLRLGNSIPSAAAYFASAWKYLCLKNCLVLIFMSILSIPSTVIYGWLFDFFLVNLLPVRSHQAEIIVV